MMNVWNGMKSRFFTFFSVHSEKLSYTIEQCFSYVCIVVLMMKYLRPSLYIANTLRNSVHFTSVEKLWFILSSSSPWKINVTDKFVFFSFRLADIHPFGTSISHNSFELHIFICSKYPKNVVFPRSSLFPIFFSQERFFRVYKSNNFLEYKQYSWANLTPFSSERFPYIAHKSFDRRVRVSKIVILTPNFG